MFQNSQKHRSKAHSMHGEQSSEGSSLPSNPAWFGRCYPSWDDLLDHAIGFGCLVGVADLGDQALFIVGEGSDPHVILLPASRGLQSTWLLAHELGHLVQHAGPRGRMLQDKDESQADRWAARALIPESRILEHHNACTDALIAALSAHYEELPLHDCPSRRLAARIARIRLQTLQDVA